MGCEAKQDYYIWRDPAPDGGPPNNYPSFFSGSAWQLDEATGQYYLHYFAVKQPDLNWEHEPVRDEVYDVMKFWLDKGVAGFRMDVIPFISKQPGLPDLTPDQRRAAQFTYANGPRVHEFLHEMHTEVLGPYEAMSIGEAFGVTLDDAHLFTDARREELSMIFHFDAVRLNHPTWRRTDWTLPEFKAIYTAIDRAAGEHGWSTSFLGNHDNPRPVSSFGNDTPEWRERSRNLPSPSEALVVRVTAEQFAWNIHYPGPDGKFGKRDPKLVAADNPLGLDRNDPDGKDDVTTITYRAPPLGLRLEAGLAPVARLILDDLAARHLTPDLVHAHKFAVEGFADAMLDRDGELSAAVRRLHALQLRVRPHLAELLRGLGRGAEVDAAQAL